MGGDDTKDTSSLYLTLKEKQKLGADIVSPMKRHKEAPRSPASARRRKMPSEALGLLPPNKNSKARPSSACNRGQKKKKIKFRDELEGQELCDVLIVESYKRFYNVEEIDTQCTCACKIF